MRVYFTVCWVWFKLQLSDLPRFKVYRHIFWRTYTYGRRQAATIAKRSRTTLRLPFLQRTRVDPQKCNVKSKWRANLGQLRDLIIKTLTISANYVTTCVIRTFTCKLHQISIALLLIQSIYKGEQTRKKCTELGEVTKNNLGPIYYDRRFLSDVQCTTKLKLI